MTQLSSRAVNEGWVQETPAGVINGVNVTFTLSFTPDDSAGLDLEQDGIGLKVTTHYTISGLTITMVTAPALGQELYARYTKKT